VAIGEFGLDYDRTQFCPVDVQKKYFEKQFELCDIAPKLPLFLHLRGTLASDDFVEIVEVSICFFF
jgi:TatD DNase family protein